VRSPQELTERFRSEGLKVTPQRQLLFSLLHNNTEHPTAEALYSTACKQMPGISLRTVYQTLSDLTSMGELGQVSIDNGPARFDPNITDHHHAVCDICGAIFDIHVDGTAKLATDIDNGFTPSSMSIVYHGSCASCVAA